MRRLFVPLACAALITSLAQAQSPVPPSTLPAASAAAPQTVALTLENAVQTALQQNPQLRAAAAELDANDGAVRQAGLIPNPVLAVDQEDTRSSTRTTTVQLSQTLEMGGKRAARVELAQRGKDIAALDLVTRRSDIRAMAVQAFFDALTAQERVKVAEESLRIAGSGADAAMRRVTAGKVSPTEETRARVAQSTARIDLRLARGELRVTVEDDGVGLQACGETGHFGLSIMRERALAIGAGLSVKTIPPRGTRVALRLPGVALDPEEKVDAQRHLAADR